MSNRRRNRMRAVTALKITPFLVMMGLTVNYVISTFSGNIEQEIKHQDLLDAIVIETEPEEEIITEVETETNTEMELETEQETISQEEDSIIETVEEIEYPKIIPLDKEIQTSSELLENDYEFQNIDFETLKDINNDSCAWISVDGTNINLPIVQGNDNEYYLKHDIEGNESKFGTLYVDYRNNSLDVKTSDLSDFTIVYGHHMSGGKMLAPICNYKSQSYYDNHKFGVVYTPDGYAYEAEFFAGVIIDGTDDSQIFTSDIIDESMYNAYINNIREKSTFTSDVEVEYGDKVLALVTCSYETNNSRYVLYAVLNRQYTNENQMKNSNNKGLELK